MPCGGWAVARHFGAAGSVIGGWCAIWREPPGGIAAMGCSNSATAKQAGVQLDYGEMVDFWDKKHKCKSLYVVRKGCMKKVQKCLRCATQLCNIRPDRHLLYRVGGNITLKC